MTSSHGGVCGDGRRGDKVSTSRARTNAAVDRSALGTAGATGGVTDAAKAADRQASWGRPLGQVVGWDLD